VRLEFQLQGDLRAAFTGQFAQVSKAVDQGLDLTAKQTLDFGRVVMRTGPGRQGRQHHRPQDLRGHRRAGHLHPLVQDGQSIPYAFSVGATIRPKERQFLAVPSPGSRPANCRPASTSPASCRPGPPPIITTGTGRRTAGVRLSPKTFEYKTGP
jgi:hypothetical protein